MELLQKKNSLMAIQFTFQIHFGPGVALKLKMD